MRRITLLASMLLAACGSSGSPDTDAGASDGAVPDASRDASSGDSALDAGRLGLGAACDAAAECASGQCVDGVCCDTACDGECVACVASSTGGSDGTCAAVTGGTDPASECSAESPESCGVAGMGCNGDADAPGCVRYDDATVCAPAACTEGNATGASFCDGAGTCVTPLATGCGPYVCVDDACGSSCTTHDECADGYFCDAGSCVETVGAGEACDEAAECDSGFCVDGVCCDTACDGGCGVCSVAAGATADGTCSAAARGSAGSCAAPALCDGSDLGCVDACVDGSASPTQRVVDVIVVVDNSGSMTQEIVAMQDAINASFADLLTAANVDYRVILVARHGSATSGQSVCIEAPLSGIPTGGCAPPPPQPIETARFFHHSVEVASHNAWCIALQHLTTPDEFGFHPSGYGALLRTGALKDFVIVSDDDTACTYGGMTYNSSNTLAGGLTAAMGIENALFARPEHFGTAEAPNFRVDAFVGLPGMAPVGPEVPVNLLECSTTADGGVTHQTLAARSGGSRYSVCDTTNYGPYFAHLAQQLVVDTRCKLDLPAAPVGETSDLDTLRAVVTFGDASTLDVPRVADAGSCAGDGFFVNGSEVQLCPDTCDDVAADGMAEIRVIHLCE
ncbi:MAG: hypothetical protein H6721_11520 [Sandaracinus sp.]|nr:hypothetical protein [Sandaracinus sp.]